MADVTFKPWVGSKYGTDNMFGQRVLVLGESHRGDPAESTSIVTIDVVRLDGMRGPHSFFTKTAKLLLKMDASVGLSAEQRAAVWEHVAFYNYVQTFAGPTLRMLPSESLVAALVLAGQAARRR